ncbi:MAG: class I SAM-dependent methyltransferase [Desulfovibrio sp.]|jgi:demethylmenaquinone methyltransferase/2-methoxy-6-polyprenyl-1,4-benzoquinol methylase|nr:class I SAM-dependent methyltransferase [Desulfovibrio sp.]
MQQHEKGNVFTGRMAGSHYRRWSRLLGMGDGFYGRIAGTVVLRPGMRALDLGCGPGSLCYALAQSATPQAEVIGLDLSPDQLAEARRRTRDCACQTRFLLASMDEVPLPDNSVDLVVSSLALHETPPQVRRGAIAEVARLLRPGGRFILADLGRPGFGLWSMIWLPMIYLHRHHRHHPAQGESYETLCQDQGLLLEQQSRINSMVHRQVFRTQKQAQAAA